MASGMAWREGVCGVSWQRGGDESNNGVNVGVMAYGA